MGFKMFKIQIPKIRFPRSTQVKWQYKVQAMAYNQTKKEYVDTSSFISTSCTSPLSILSQVIEEQFTIQEKNNVWMNAPLEKMDKLKNDFSGKVGEKFLVTLCSQMGTPVQWTEDVNSKDGTYDLKIYGKKVEVKTARLGRDGKTFQHENLKKSGCDFFLFLDIKPNSFYLTILPSFDLSKKCMYMNRTPHLRKGTDDVYKFDFYEKGIREAIQKGVSIEVNDSCNQNQIKEFIQKRIIEVIDLEDDGLPQIENLKI
jgi:hypothetical protein